MSNPFSGIARWVSLALFLSLYPSLLHADSTLSFPRLSFETDVLTGVAIVNTSAQDATVTFTAYGADGKPLAGSGIKNPVQIAIPGGQQFAKLTAELFGAGLDPSTAAWFQATSPTDGLTGFFLLLNSSITMMDGADLPVASHKCIFNYVRLDSGFSTELNIINPGDATANLQIQLMGLDSAPISKAISLPAKGVARLDPAAFFQVEKVAAGTHVFVDSNVDVAGFELVKGSNGDAVGLNSQRSAERLGTMYFLQLSVLGSKSSQLGIINYSADPVILTISAFKPDGTLYDSANLQNNPVTRTLLGGASLREDIAAMFGFHGDLELEGWITVKSTAEAINGYVTYGVPSTSAAAAIPSAAQGRKRAIFSHIATTSGFNTGLTLLNPGSLPANVRVMVLRPSREILGAYDAVLQPGQRFSKRLGADDFVPQAANQLGGFIWIKSDLPLYMSSLISSDKVLANIPPQDAPETYNPDVGMPTLKVKPSMAIVPPGSSQRFQIEGASANPVWKVNGTAGGTATTGTITSGLFAAPKSVPTRQVVTITAEAAGQAAGASADVLAKTAFITELRVVQAIAYLDSISKIYAAELVALGASAGQQGVILAAATGNSQIFDISPVSPKTLLASFDNENIVKMLPFKARDKQEYLLLLGQTRGRIIRLNPLTKQWKDSIVAGFNAPTAMVFDPVTGDLLVAEKDKVTTVPRDSLQADLAASEATPPGSGEAFTPGDDFGLPKLFATSGVTGIAVDRCTGKVYLSVAAEGTIVEYNLSTKSFRTVVSGLQNPGQLLALYRQGVSCPESFHLLVAERGANRVDLVIPQTGVVTEWIQAPGINDLVFIPTGNPYTSQEGVLLCDYTVELNGAVYLVPMSRLYENKPANPPEQSLVEVRADLSVGQTHSPASVSSGNPLQFVATVTNNGPSTATGVTLVERLPIETTLVSSASSQGTCSQSGNTVQCALGTLAAARKATVTVTVKPKPLTSQSSIKVANTAIVSASEADPDPTNNFSTDYASVLPPQAAKMELSAPTDAFVGSSFGVGVTVKDEQGNPASSYRGTVVFSSSDEKATLPAAYGFTASDNGVRSFPSSVRLRSLGSQSITVRDADNPSLSASQSVKVVGGGVSSLEFSQSFVAATAGVPFNVIVYAKDAGGNVSPDAERVHFSSTDPQAVLPPDYTFYPIDNGSHMFAVTLRTAGNQTVTVTIASFAPAGGAQEFQEGPSLASATLTVQVAPGPAASLLVSAPATATSGSAFTATATAKDAYGNIATGYAGSVTLSASPISSSESSILTGSTGGVFTFKVVLSLGGTRFLIASGTGGISGSASLKVVGGDYLLISAPSATAAGSAFTVIVTAKDGGGNTITSYPGPVTLSASPAGANEVFNSISSVGGVFMFSVNLTLAGTRTLNASGTSGLAGSTSIAVSPASASSLLVSAPTAVTAGTAFTATATAKDAYNNTITSYPGPVTLSASPAGANEVFKPISSAGGVFTFSVILIFAGPRGLDASGSVGGISGTTSLTVNPAAANYLFVSAPTAAIAGTAFATTVTVKDPYDNIVTGYSGTVTLSASPTGANESFNLAASGNGNFTFSVTLNLAGTRSLTASGAGGISGSAPVTVSSGAITMQFLATSSSVLNPFLPPYSPTSAAITVILSAPAAVDTTAEYIFTATGPNAAAPGLDFALPQLPSPWWFTIPAGQTTTTINVSILANSGHLSPPAKTFNVVLQNPFPAQLGSQTTHTVTITP